MGNRS